MFNLFITSAEGRVRKSLRSPYEERRDAEATVRMATGDTTLETAKETAEFAKTVTAAPLGRVIRHEKTGISFRTEAAS